MRIHHFLLLALLGLGQFAFSQIKALEIKPEKEKMYTPYMLHRHSGIEGLAEFKKEKPQEYLKELWYYSESFYVKRNHLNEGYVLNEEIIDISRFENSRKENEEAIVVLPGFKDVLVLLPSSQLIYKP
jgi:hypothetical protein